MTHLLNDFEGDCASSSTDRVGKGESRQVNSSHFGHSDLRGVGHDTRTDESRRETANDLGDQIDIPGSSDDLEYSGLITQLCSKFTVQ